MTAPDETPPAQEPAQEPPAPAQEPPAPAQEPRQPAPQPATAQQNQFIRGRPFQIGLAAVAGIAIGCVGGAGIGFVAGHHFDGRRPHGYHQDFPRRDRLPVQPPRKIPVKPQPTRPNPAPSVTPTA